MAGARNKFTIIDIDERGPLASGYSRMSSASSATPKWPLEAGRAAFGLA
jgi:hypothetical protein